MLDGHYHGDLQDCEEEEEPAKVEPTWPQAMSAGVNKGQNRLRSSDELCSLMWVQRPGLASKQLLVVLGKEEGTAGWVCAQVFSANDGGVRCLHWTALPPGFQMPWVTDQGHLVVQVCSRCRIDLPLLRGSACECTAPRKCHCLFHARILIFEGYANGSSSL